MRLNKLNLEYFGHFTNTVFDFGKSVDSNGVDFHVIYGPNEAGKTTLKEGFLRLLYGFPRRDPYDYFHQRKNLRVSGELGVDNGAVSLTRLPGNSPSLRDMNDAPVPDSAILAHLHSISESDYRNLFCLDDETIEQGGEEIINAKADMGRLLFSTKSGISDLSGILEKVRSEADEIYKKKGRSTLLATLKGSQTDVDRSIRELDVPSNEYRKLKRTYDVARKEESQISQNRTGLFERKSEVQLRIKAFPLVDEIEELESSLKGTENWPQSVSINPEDLIRMIPEQSRCEGETKRLSGELAELKQQLEQFELNREHLGLDGKLKDMDVLKSRHVAADEDLENRKRERTRIHDQMFQIVREFTEEDSLDPLEVSLSGPVLTKFTRIRENIQDALNRVSTEQEEIDLLKGKLEVEQGNYERLTGDNPKSSEIAQLFKQFNIDSLSNRHAKACEAVENAKRNVESSLDNLKIKGQKFESIPKCALTVKEVEHYSKQLEDLKRELVVEEKNVNTQTLDMERLGGEIKRLKTVDGLVGDEETQELKAQRDKLWQEHKKNLTESSARKFEGVMTNFDDAMTGRLEHASDLGKLRQLEQQMVDCSNKSKVAKDETSRLNREIKKLEAKLADAAKNSGLKSPILPSALEEWLRNVEIAVKATSEFERQLQRNQKIFAQVEEVASQLKKHIPLKDPEFDELLDTAKDALERQRHHQEQTRAVKGRVDDIQRELKSRQNKLKTLSDNLKNAQQEWSKLVKSELPVGIDAERLAEVPDSLRELSELNNLYQELNHRITTMEKDQENFSSRVGQLAIHMGIESGDDPLKTFNALENLNVVAQEEQDRFEELERKIEECREGLETAERKLTQMEATIREHARIFPEGTTVETIQDLRDATIKAIEIVANRAKLAKLKGDLQNSLNVDTIDDARTELSDLSFSDLQASLEEIEADLAKVEEDYKIAIETKTAAKTRLGDIGGDMEVAQLVERRSTLELERRDAVLKFLKLNFGYKLAEEAIRRFRDKHRSAMMKNTEVAFDKLTNGTYKSLRVMSDGSEEILVAVHSSGSAKRAAELSKGTRFQLYLALRAAAHQQLVDQGTSLPFFCDDIFETFDEDRTRSACRIMEQIGSSGQAIYLTHHHHVVDIAQEICGKNVQIHHIQTE